MTEFKGTPGPWSIENPSEDTPSIWIVAENDNGGIAKIEVCDYGDGQGERHTNVDKANSFAISAVPDLIEALMPFAALLDAIELQSNGPKKGVWYSCESSVVGMREISMEDFAFARAAIAKALGQ